jgi:putative transposase
MSLSSCLWRSIKYEEIHPRAYASVPEARARIGRYLSFYNCDHLYSAIRFVTPVARRAGHDRATLAYRASLYANARAQNPKHWSGKTRNWQPTGPVWLNPETEINAPEIRDAACEISGQLV